MSELVYMSQKVILVVLDGLEYGVGEQCMGFLQALREQGQATLYKLQCELPSMSRPLYEAILTGVAPVNSGIVHNAVCRLSTQQSVFSLARAAGLTTAAAAYHWFSELYNRAPFSAKRDRHTADPELAIQYGTFYHQDHYPDDHLFADAEALRRQHDPDFLLVHPMNIDDAGHKAGWDSTKYRNTARHADMALSEYLPDWLAAGYQVLVTSDHGMNNDFSHGGILPEERMVPLYVMGQGFSHHAEARPQQLELCGAVCQLLGIQGHGKAFPKDFLHADFSGVN
ncbi:alkaline phosphatase family protein [Aliamphritea hakodatensis]|uniref:alkaline phosphatase family protein n=1 Tax=Aliamphritea hakodatensis TaxID=2895352 RepID=UPI0022FD6151|nr:alkaline phosphatase family protein [Aliamphritea hakodatensis]